jgi:nucleoside-diphosphate-sugar epimerase
MARGNLKALIARSADFYGPGVRTSVANRLVLDKLVAGNRAAWLVNDRVRHSWTFTPDAGRSLALLAATESAWNQTWHVPTAPSPPNGREFIAAAAKAFGVEPKHRVLRRALLKLAGLFDSDISESYEMLYQYDAEYLFDASKFAAAFSFAPTGYAEGIAQCAEHAKRERKGERTASR